MARDVARTIVDLAQQAAEREEQAMFSNRHFVLEIRLRGSAVRASSWNDSEKGVCGILHFAFGSKGQVQMSFKTGRRHTGGFTKHVTVPYAQMRFVLDAFVSEIVDSAAVIASEMRKGHLVFNHKMNVALVKVEPEGRRHVVVVGNYEGLKACDTVEEAGAQHAPVCCCGVCQEYTGIACVPMLAELLCNQRSLLGVCRLMFELVASSWWVPQG
jgi:hypothetical protein